MKKIVRTGAHLCASAGAFIVFSTAGAQSVPTEPGGGTAPVIEDIIVLARRVEESQQRVPLAVTTVTQERLTDATVSAVEDIQFLVPSLQIGQANTGAENFTIRGSFNGVYNDPGVIAYLDEVPIDSRLIGHDLYDLSSVQELKGPQGTLFGRNSTGGAVLFFANRPNLDGTDGYVTARYGNHNERRLEGAVNLPLGDTFAVRVAGEVERRDGILESVTAPGQEYGNRDNQALRVTALWAPNDAIENYTQIAYYNQREFHMPEIMTSLATPCTGVTTPSPLCLYQPPFNSLLGTGNVLAYFKQQQTLPSDRTVNDANNNNFARRTAITNSFSYRLGEIDLHNVTYYADSSLSYNNDFDGTPVPAFDVYQPSHTHSLYTETRVHGKALEDRLDWQAGGVYSDDLTGFREDVYLFQLPVSSTYPLLESSRQDFQSYALFGQATYDLSSLLQGLSLTGGYRHTWDDRVVDTTVFQGQPKPICGQQTLPVPASGPVPFPDTDLATCTRHLPLAFDSYNYNVTLNWQMTDKTMVYFATRRGYKAGGFNQNARDPSLAVYQPESNTDYEIGLKSDWKLGTVPVRTNIAAFQENYTNIQAETVSINPQTGAILVLVQNQDPVTGQKNEAVIKGVELEVTAAPTTWLQVSAFYTRLDATYDKFIDAVSRVNLAGQGIGGVIPETYGATAQIQIPTANWADGLTMTLSYYGTAAPLTNASVPGTGDPRETLDMRLAARDLFHSGADLALWGKNLTDHAVCANNPAVSGSVTRGLCGDPRTFGLELSYRFGR